MPVLILIVLVVIAVLLAPWLLAVIVAGVAAYGVLLISAFILAVVFALGAAVWITVRSYTKPREPVPIQIHGERRACRSCQAEMAVSAKRCHNCSAEN